MRKAIGLIVLLLISLSTHATEHVGSECSDEGNRVFLKNQHISKYLISTIMSGKEYAFKIEVDKKWFKVILKEGEDPRGYRDQFSSTARIAKILNIPVNVCVDTNGGYLLGIELL
ncbi:hypothetical protein J5069_10120 [Candidatus Symbiopectobacterium sp. NZEC127]|uniref:hypothetical protein n=1 Tax=Candidatus Symbiopectobacterium sp. NZEC127 TaxID=2820472 RepID=UPI0022275DCD|nr:hypothetical protein [Candidatus Symbiopectobacterium sp. NZEC127]MCW2486250.1 hypothetical protein [Candidatus Symbiopectobacterium sp. NZEC127]